MNWQTVRAFLAASTQWRTVAGARAAVRLGLDYAGVKAALDFAGIESGSELFDGLRVMEDEALSCFNEQLEASA